MKQKKVQNFTTNLSSFFTCFKDKKNLESSYLTVNIFFLKIKNAQNITGSNQLKTWPKKKSFAKTTHAIRPNFPSFPRLKKSDFTPEYPKARSRKQTETAPTLFIWSRERTVNRACYGGVFTPHVHVCVWKSLVTSRKNTRLTEIYFTDFSTSQNCKSYLHGYFHSKDLPGVTGWSLPFFNTFHREMIT